MSSYSAYFIESDTIGIIYDYYFFAGCQACMAHSR